MKRTRISPMFSTIFMQSNVIQKNYMYCIMVLGTAKKKQVHIFFQLCLVEMVLHILQTHEITCFIIKWMYSTPPWPPTPQIPTPYSAPKVIYYLSFTLCKWLFVRWLSYHRCYTDFILYLGWKSILIDTRE